MSTDPAARGYVYILLNPAFTHFVKIGKTTKEPHLRAREISIGTGVPAPYQVAWEVQVTDCHEAERKVHEELDQFRARGNREFFSLPLRDAIALVAKLTAPYAVAPALEVLANATATAEAETSEAVCVPDTAQLQASAPRPDRPKADAPRGKGVELLWSAVSADALAAGMPQEIRSAVGHVLALIHETGVKPIARQRGDGAWVFVPSAQTGAGTGRNLLTIWVTKNRVRIRIMPAAEEIFDPAKASEYTTRLKEWLRCRD